MPLKGKDQLQVFAFPTVIQKPIIPDLLETGWEHMHQVTADEFDVIQSDYPARFPGLFPPGRKSDLLFIDRKDGNRKRKRPGCRFCKTNRARQEIFP